MNGNSHEDKIALLYSIECGRINGYLNGAFFILSIWIQFYATTSVQPYVISDFDNVRRSNYDLTLII